LPDYEEIEGTLKYLKNLSQAAEKWLSKHGGCNTGDDSAGLGHGPARLYQKTGPKGYYVQCLIKKTNSRLCKLLRDLPASFVQHYQAEFSQANRWQTNSLPCAKSWKS
jgi:hypothetical protein